MNKLVWRIYIQSKTTDFAEKSQIFANQDAAMRARNDMARAFPNLDVSIIGQIENESSYGARLIKADEWEANYRKYQSVGHNMDECNTCKAMINERRNKILRTEI